DRDKLEQLATRIKLRRQLRLPARECVDSDPPPEASHCVCLVQTVDALIESGEKMTRREVLKAARQAHADRWDWLKRRPEPQPIPRAEPKPAVPRIEPVARRAPIPEAVTETNTKPARLIKRRPRWYDPHP